MLTKVKSGAIFGLQSVPVDVEVNVNNRGFPSFDIIGLPSKAINESKERVKNAIINSGLEFPTKKITVNLAPADLPKEGAFYDLPIAVGIIACEQGIEVPQDALFFGELSLDGALRFTRGGIMFGTLAKDEKYKNLHFPEPCAGELKLISDVNLYSASSLRKVLEQLAGVGGLQFRSGVVGTKVWDSENSGNGGLSPEMVGDEDLINEEVRGVEKQHARSGQHTRQKTPILFEQVLGQESAKRALVIAASGGHNILLNGPPGSGKTMLAKSITSIMPRVDDHELLDVLKIYSVSGTPAENITRFKNRPFRSPHHSISHVGLVGGGGVPKPGEISLAHRGVLFLDEFGEFQRKSLEVLRQPLEDREVTVTRSFGSVTFPAAFMLVAATNPCPCGFYGHPKKSCTCTPRQVFAYGQKLSGPILDRIDLQVNVLPVETKWYAAKHINKNPDLTRKAGERGVGLTSEGAKKLVEKARKIQKLRFEKLAASGSPAPLNSEMTNNDVAEHCKLTPETEALLKRAVDSFSLSARSYFKLLKIGRTIADLAGEEVISTENLAEALQYKIRVGKEA